MFGKKEKMTAGMVLNNMAFADYDRKRTEEKREALAKEMAAYPKSGGTIGYVHGYGGTGGYGSAGGSGGYVGGSTYGGTAPVPYRNTIKDVVVIAVMAGGKLSINLYT